MSTVTQLQKKTKKYEFACRLADAIISLTPAYWEPARAIRFAKKTGLLWPEIAASDKHLGHGLHLFLRLAEESGVSLPDFTHVFYIRHQEEIELRNLAYLKITSELIQMFSKHHIPCTALKGIAYYAAGDSSYFHGRVLSDCDLLVSQDNFEKAHDLLRSSGFALIDEETPPAHSASFSKPFGDILMLVDLHHTIPVLKGTPEFAAKQRIEHILTRAKKISWKSFPLVIPCPEDLFWHFFMHACFDFRGQISLVEVLAIVKDLRELQSLFPSVDPLNAVRQENTMIQKGAEELLALSAIFFANQKAPPQRLPPPDRLLANSFALWVPKKTRAAEIGAALFLARHVPFFLKASCFCYVLWQNGFASAHPHDE